MSTKFSVEDEFKEAQKWLLTDEDIERAKIMLGHDSAEARDLYITDASENNIERPRFVEPGTPLRIPTDVGRT